MGALKSQRKRMAKTRRINPDRVRSFVENVVGDDMHAKRVLSLGNAVVGAMFAASLSIHAIGQGLAASQRTMRKHGVKQVDRLLSNGKLDVWSIFAAWVPFVVGQRKEVVVALDWTEFDKDDHSTIALYLVTSHGRATPLLWRTVKKSELKDARNGHEDAVLLRLHEVLPRDVRVTVLADRAFGDHTLYDWLQEIGWDFAIRFRECILVTNAAGTSKPASEWLFPTGRARMLRGVRVTQNMASIPAAVLVKAPRMKEAWCIATSRSDLTAAQVTKLYGRRFTIEETFRDQKDIRFGLGLSATHIRNCARRDRLLLIAAMAEALLVLLGAAGEAANLDRMLQTNTSKKRQLSLFRQGLIWYEFLPGLKEEHARLLMREFDRLISAHAVFKAAYGIL
jgi:hypothetical protein